MPPPFQLSVDGLAGDLFRVQSFTGTEALSEAWAFDVVVVAPAGEEVEQTALGRRAVLTFHVGPEPRAFYGVVAAVRLAAALRVDQPRLEYVVRVVPRLWLLKRRRRTRIFQRMRVPDIVAQVLGEAGIAARFQLTRGYPERETCTQYEESGYQFVRRILAEAGIFFYFFGGGPLGEGAAATAGSEVAGALGALVGAAAQGAEAPIPGDTVVCADDAAAYPPVAGDDAAALAASTAAALAPAAADAGGGMAGAASGAAVGAASAGLEDSARAVPTLSLLAGEGTRGDRHDKITRFTLRNTVRSTAATFRDYDPSRPQVRLQSTAVSTAPFPPSPLEAAAMAAAAAENTASVTSALPAGAGALGAALGQRAPLEVYDHHAPFLFPKWGFAADEAPRMLRQKRRRASIARGEGGCSDFSPGHRFSLQDHPAAQLDGLYVVLRVEHRGQAHPDASQAGEWRVYSNDFECAPVSVPYVPRRPRRESVQVALTATVVGPPGSDIHVDALGQVKVQFHWDREGKFDAQSSCWIRVMQPWAGAGWGHQFIPRLGQEVVVVFEGGDPDKPMILGALYNGTHPPPFALPGDKTKSGIRTQTSPGGSGFNELSFEDAAGREQIYLHAQANLNEVVGKNHTVLVRSDEFLRVLGSRQDHVEKSREERVKGDSLSEVGGHRTEIIAGNREERVSGMAVARVEGREKRLVQKEADLDYQGDLTTRVQGNMTTVVGRSEKKRSWVTHAEGTAALSGGDRLDLSSEKELVLRVGKSTIRITAAQIEVLAAGLSAKGDGGAVSVDSEGIVLQSKDKARLSLDTKLFLKTDGASLSMEKQVKIDGSQILLNSPDKATDTPPKDPEPPTTLVLQDADKGAPLPAQRYLIRLAGGAEVSGVTDKDGKADLSLASGGKVFFPDLTLPGDFSGGTPAPYVIRQGDYLQKLAFAHGFDEEAVWNDPKNAALKDTRKDPNLLLPGDVIHFPRSTREGQPLSKGTTNTYKAKVPTTKVHFTFEDAKGPLAGEAYVIEGLGAPLEGTADGTGKVEIEAPVHVREVRVTFKKKGLIFPVFIGDMDPIDEPSGVRQRLQHLGYLQPAPDALSEEAAAHRDTEAITAFQRDKGLSPTGTIDDATRSALDAAHGT